MKIAISNIAWNAAEDNTIAALLQKYNIQGLEIAPTKIWKDPINTSEQDIATYKKYWNNKGISIVAMQSLLYGHPELTIFETSEQRNSLVNYLQQIIALASKLGVQTMVFGSPKNRIRGNIKQEQVFVIANEFFNKIGDVAKQYEINICIEANPKKYGTDFLNTTNEVVQFVKLVGHPNINVHIDSGAMKINQENYAGTIISSLPFSHFHISEDDLVPVPYQVDHKTIVETLQSVHYNKWVSIEMRQVLTQNNHDQIEKTLKFVTETYQK